MVIREGRRDDFPYLVNLMNKQYSRKKDLKYFDWQFFLSPCPTILICAEKNGIPVGMLGIQEHQLKNGLIGGQLIDMLIDSNFRGKGIFKTMIDFAISRMNYLDFLYVLPNLNGKNAIEKQNWLTLTKIDQLICRNITSYQFDNLSSYFYEKNLLSFSFSKKYYFWRINNHPIYKYNTISAEDNKIIYKEYLDESNNQQFIDIVKYEFTENSIANMLLSRLSDIIKSNKIITTWALEHTDYYKYFINKGFIAESTERYFCIKPLSNHLDILMDKKNWHINQIDAEIF